LTAGGKIDGLLFDDLECERANQDATVVSSPRAQFPDSARNLGMGAVSVGVQVTIDPTGMLIGEKISQTSNNMAIDAAALRAARQSSYLPRTSNCLPMQGDVVLRIDFDPRY